MRYKPPLILIVCCSPALYLPVIGFGNWGQMGKRQRAQELAMAPLEASTGATKNVVVPVPQPPLPEAAAGTAVVSGTEIETEIGIESETGSGTETVIETGSGTETGTEIETGTGSATERALSAVSDLGYWEVTSDTVWVRPTKGYSKVEGELGLCLMTRFLCSIGSDSFPERRAPRKGNTLYVYGEDMTPTLLRGAFSPFGNIIDLSMDPPRK